MHLYSAFAVMFLAIWSSSAADFDGQATNLELAPEVASRYSQPYGAAPALADPTFDARFYATAPTFASSSPGDLLKVEPLNLTGLNVSAGTSVFRFQYTSIDINRTSAPSTGFIAFPFKLPKEGVHGNKSVPLVALAHGTVGVYRRCAPSSKLALAEYEHWSPLLLQGYAVVATDYVGLGNNYTSHKYLSLADHANDVYLSTIAARKAFPDVFTDKWMSVGHSQGGGAVWKLAEHPIVQQPDSGYVGTVSIAPTVNALNLVTAAYKNSIPPTNLRHYIVTTEIPYFLLGIKAAFPDYRMPWAAEGLKKSLISANRHQICDLTNVTSQGQIFAFGDQTPMNDSVLTEWTLQHAPAYGAPASMPMLLIQGLQDTTVLPRITLDAFNSATRINTVGFLEYPDLDHRGVVAGSTPEWLEFMKNRFSDQPTGFETYRHTIPPNSASITTV